MPILECKKCLPVNVPDRWTKEKKSEIAGLVRKVGPISAIHYSQPIWMSLSDAKNIYLHITREKGFCHHCRTQLTEYEEVCPKCRRLNLDW